MSMCMLSRKHYVNGKLKTRFTVGAALLAASMLFVSCPREVGLGGAVDTQKPLVSILTPEVDAVIKDVITLSGKASDETSLESVTVLFTSTEAAYTKEYPATFDVTAGTWSLTIDTEDATNGLPDYKYEVTVTAKDNSGKTSIAARSFQIDNSAPTILVTKPSTYGGNNEKETVTYYKQVEIRGEAYDASAIKSIKVGLYKEDGTLLLEKAADGTDTWSVQFSLSELASIPYSNGSSVSDPVYIYVTATDKANNVSSYYYHKSDMYSLLKTKKTAQTDELYFPTTTQIGYLDANRAALTVSGVKQDNTPISVPVTKEELNGTKHPAFDTSIKATYPRLKFTTAATASIEWNNIDKASPSIAIGSEVLVSIQPASDGSSVNLDSLDVKLVRPNDPAYVSQPLEFTTLRMGEAVNLSIKVPTTQATGIYDLVLYGTTNAGGIIGFSYDDANPPANADLIDNDGYIHSLSIESTSIAIPKFKPALVTADTVYPDPTPVSADANIWYVNNDFYLIGDVTGMGVNTTVQIIINNGTPIEVPKTGLTGVWDGTSYENSGQILHLKYKVNYSTMPDVATVVLKAGAVTKQSNIEKDAIGPTVAITSPVDGKAYADTIGDLITLKGTATDDGAGVKAVYYTLDGTDPTTSSAQAAKTGSSWTISWPSSNAEGKYILKVIAEDNLSPVNALSDIATVTFYKDGSAPGLTETGVGSSDLTTTGNFSLKGKAWDNDQIDEITVSAIVNGSTKTWSSKEGGDTAADATGKIKKVVLKPDSEVNSKVASESLVTAENWKIDFKTGISNSGEATYIPDGTTTFTITIKDISGKSSAYTRTVTVDTVLPSFPTGSTGFANKVVGKDINSFNTLTVTVKDDPQVTGGYASGLEGVYYQITDESVTTAPDFVTTADEANWTAMGQSQTGYTANVDFDSVSGDVYKKAWIAAKDRAGNRSVSTATYSTFIDQHKPVLSIVTADSDSNYNLEFTDDVKVKVRITDSNPGTLTSVVVKNPQNNAITFDTGTDISISAPDTHTGYTDYIVTIPFKSNPDKFKNNGAYNDGNYIVTFIGNDVSDTTDYRVSDSITHTILMDTQPPVVNITNYPGSLDTQYLNVGSITITGTVFDARLDKVEAWFNSDTAENITSILEQDTGYTGYSAANPDPNYTKFSWTKYGLGEGVYVAHVQATDKAQSKNDTATNGKTSAAIIIDLTDPVSTLTQETAGTIYTEAGVAISDATTELTGTDTYLAKSAFTLKGVITEANLESATLTVKKDNVAVAGSPFNLMQAGTNNTWAPGTQTWTYTQASGVDGTYTYTLTLKDKAQRQTTKNLTVKLDTTAPTVNITAPGAGESFLTTPVAIKGTAIDNGAGANKVYYTFGASSGAVADPTTSSTAIDVTGSSWSTSILTGADEAEGTFTLKVISADKLGNLSDSDVKTVQFSYDKNDPDLTSKAYVTSTLSAATPTEIADGASTTGNFTLKGKAWDTNQIDEITVSATVNGTPKTWSSKEGGGTTGKILVSGMIDTAINSKVNAAANVSADNWSINFTTGDTTTGATYIPDGTTTFTITIKDIAGKTRSYNRSITVDTKQPAFSTATGQGFANAVVGKDINPYNTLTVKVTDDPRVTGGYASGIEGVYYKITEETENTVPSFTTDDGWTAMSQGSSGYTATVDFSAVNTDKSQKAWIAAKDRAGNRIISGTTYSTFIDQQKPSMTVSGETFTSKNQGNNAHDLTLTVRVTDSNPTAPTVAVYKPKDDGTAIGNVSDLTPYASKLVSVGTTSTSAVEDKIYIGVSGTPTAAHTDYTVRIPFKSNPDIFDQDGQVTIIINGADAKGRVADQIAHIVLQDSAAPEVTISSYAADTSINVNTITIEGIATDANMTSVKAWLTKDGTDLDSTDITNTRGQDGSFTWTNYNLAEGVYVAHVEAKDQANQVTTADTQNITVDLTAPKTTLNRNSESVLYTEAGGTVTGTTLTNGTVYLSKTGFTLEGTLEEKYLKSAKLTVKKDSTTLVNAEDMKQPVGGRNTWESAGTDAYKWTYTGGASGDGSYFITIDLEDVAGNKTQKTLTVKVDTTAPALLVTTPGEGQSSSISTITLRGTADDDGAGVATVHYAYYDINADLSATPAPTPVGQGDADITGNTWKKELTFANEGTYKLVVTATDKLGNTATTASPVTFSFDINDPELTYKAYVTSTLGAATPTEIEEGLSTNSNFTLKGKAWDTNAIDEITVSTNVGGVKKTWSSKESGGSDSKILVSNMINTAIDSKKANAAAVSADNWSISFKVGDSNSSDSMFIADGMNSFTIVIKDIAGKTRSYNRTVTVDTTSPAISLGTGDGFPAVVNGTSTYIVEQDRSPYAALKVTASDPVQAVTNATATGLAGVYYKITLDNTQPAFASDADEANWTAMIQGANNSWSANIDFSSSSYSDKDVWAWIAAKDRAGNRVVYTTSENKLKAFVDKMKPIIVVQTADDFTSRTSDLVMRVRIKDTNPMVQTGSDIEVYKPYYNASNPNDPDNGKAIDISNLAAADKVGITSYSAVEKEDKTTTADPYKEFEVTIPFEGRSTSFDRDGIYTIILNGKDAKNRAADQIVWTVLQDTINPVVTLTKYDSEAFEKVNTIAATATVSDANLTKVEAWLTKGGTKQNDTVETLYDKAAGIDKRKNGSFTYSQYSLEDAEYTVTFEATDAANRTTKGITQRITVDTKAPVSTIEQNAANLLYNTNGAQIAATMLLDPTDPGTTGTDAGTYLSKTTFTLKGVITEIHLKSAKLTVKKDNGTPTELNLYSRNTSNQVNPPSTGCTWNSGTWTYTQATTTGDGTYTYSLALEDEAGNTTTETLTVKVDTTAPSLSIATPGTNQTASTSPMTIRGTADDDGAGVEKVVYSYLNNALDSQATLNGNSWSDSISFSTEGSFTLYAKAIDKLGHESSPVATVPFSYDKYDPELKELVVGNDSTTVNTGFTLGGTAWDSNQIDEITISTTVGNETKIWSNKSGTGKIQVASIITADGIEAGKATTTDGRNNVTTNNWSMDFVVGDSHASESNFIADGMNSFTIVITDISGKSRSYNRTITVDSKAPTINLQTGDGFANATVAQDTSPYNMLRATVADDPQVTGGYATGLEGVWYKIAATQPVDNAATWSNIAAGTDGWTAMSQGATQWMANVDFSNTTTYNADGTQKAWIAAKDRAGNKTILTTAAETYIDRHLPVLSIDPATNDNFTAAAASLEIIVRETDTNPNTPTVTVLKPQANGTAGGTAMTTSEASVSIEASTTTADYKEYKVTIPFTSGNYSADGVYTLQINASDQRSRVADQIEWEVLKDKTAPVVELSSYTTETFTSNRTLTVTGKVKDDNLSSVKAWLNTNIGAAEDITNLLGAPDAADENKQSFEWKQYDLTEGTYVVHVQATDRANLMNDVNQEHPEEAGKKSAVITVDYTAPDSTFAYEGAAPGDKLYTNTGTALLQPVLSGGGSYLAKTGFTLKGTITETNFLNATLSIKKDNVALDPVSINAAGAWSYVQAATDGTYEYTLTVNDKANNQFKQTVTVKVDTAAPILTIETPGEGQTTNQNSFGISGSVTDTGAGNGTVLYSIDGSEPSVPATIIGSTWSDTINFNNVEGAFVLKIKAKDVLGNETAVQTRNFSYDLNVPGIDENVLTVATTNTGFTLGGKAWDTNAIDEIIITGQGKTWSSKNAGEITLKPNSEVNSKVNAAADVTANNWSIDFVVGSANSSAATYVADGTIGFTITIKDIAGKQVDIARTVSVDTVKPVITEQATDGFTNGLVEKDVSPYNKLTVHASDTGTGATGLEGVWYQIAATKPAFASAADEANWTAMAQGTSNAWTANVDFSSVTANGDQFAWIAAKDRAGNRIVYEGATALDDGSIKTYVDIMKPVLSVEKMNPTTEIPAFTDAQANVDFRIRVTDTNPVAPTVSVKDGAGVAITGAGISIVEDASVDGSAGYKDWIVTVPFSTNAAKYATDGTYTFTINGMDAKSRVASPITHEILRDTTDPSVTVALTQSTDTPGYTNQGTITATGTVIDANLTTVTAMLVKDGVDQTPVDITATLGNDGSFTWKQYDQADATYEVKITATDKAGHQKEGISDQVIVDKTAPDSAFAWDTTGGVKLYNTNGSEAASLSAGGSYMAKTAFQLRGVITEANLKKGTISVSKDGATPVDYPFFQSGSFTAVDLYNSSTHEWLYDQGATSADGSYVYTIKLEDKAGNRFEKSVTVLVDTAAPTLVITKPAADEQLDTATYKFAGTISDLGAGVNTVTYVLENGGTTIDSGSATVTGGSWAINGDGGVGNAGVSLGSEGTLEIIVTATDKLGQSTIETTTFYYDQTAPSLDETEVGINTKKTGAAFAFTGTASDTNALAGIDANGVAVGAISFSTGSGVNLVDYGTADVAADGTWTKTFTPGSGTPAEAKLADGTYTFSIKATDVSGRETTIQRTVVVDTVVPVISKLTGKTAFITDTATAGWFKTGSVTLGATATDALAGISAVDYAVISNPKVQDPNNAALMIDAPAPSAADWEGTTYGGVAITWKAMSSGASGYTASAEVKDGTNYIVIRATDAAGNKAYTTQETAMVDTVEPSLAHVYSNAGYTTELLSKMTNASGKITVYIVTEDEDALDPTREGSGVDTVIAKIGNKDFTVDTIAASLDRSSGSAVNKYKLELSKPALLKAVENDTTDSQKVVYVKIKDYAGNESSPINLFTLQYDRTAPTVEFTSFTDPSQTTVNKTVKITGKANDLQGLKSVTLYYLKNSSDEANKVLIPASATADSLTGAAANNWSFELNTYVNAILDHELDLTMTPPETVRLKFIAEAEDDAGNIQKKELTVNVDQLTDCPEITINNIELDGMDATHPVWLINQKKIIGTITDDDGIDTLEMSSDNGATWKPVGVSYGSFSTTLDNDATYTILFRATDINGTTFTSGSSSSLTNLKIKGSDEEPSADGKLYVTVDTKAPQTQLPRYGLDSTSNDDDDWTENLLSGTTFGGTADTEFTIKQYAFDDNGIKKVEIFIDNSTTALQAVEDTTDTYEDPSTHNDFTAWKYTVDATTFQPVTGEEPKLSHTLKIVVTDNADMTKDTTTTFKVDNYTPTVTLKSHEDNEDVRGNFFVSGETQDAPLYGPATTMIYRVTLTPDTPTDWTITAPTSQTFGAREVNGNLGSWRVYFDNDVNNTDGYTHDLPLKNILTKLRSDLEIAADGTPNQGAVVWKEAGSGHAAGDLYVTKTRLYLHFKATDAYGNESTFCRYLLLDPQGDIPTLKVAYPSVMAYAWKSGTGASTSSILTTQLLPTAGSYVYEDVTTMTADESKKVTSYDSDTNTIRYNNKDYSIYGGQTVQGGIIRIQGTAEDEKGIKAIYMQIDPMYDYKAGFNWQADGSADMPNGNKKLSDFPTQYPITQLPNSTLYGIKVGDSVAWSATLNKSGELNGQSGENWIAVRFYAVDVDDHISPLNEADDLIIKIDTNTPQIGNSEELYLYQYDGNGNVTASMKYEDDMWLKGKWYIQGSAEDTSGIGNTDDDLKVQVPGQSGAWEDYTFTKTAKSWTGSSGYVVKFEIGSNEADSYGKLTYQIQATDKDDKTVTKLISINYDNKAPELAASTSGDYHINPEVVQSNGFYTLGSSVIETGTQTASQSGFERVALYFVRPGDTQTTGTLYDTYFQKTDTSNKLTIDLGANGAKGSGDVSYADGLYWKSQTVTRNANNLSEITLTTADANVHPGALVRIGGAMYVITSVDGTKVTIKGSPAIFNNDSAKENYLKETADFAMAIVIDHVITEGNGTSDNIVNGYYTDVVNDDDDNIVEKVTTQGFTTFWEANICSRNIPDGAIEIHYVAFDKAGNYATDVVSGTVANNAPRLAGIKYGTDDDGNGTVDANEYLSEMFAITGTGAGETKKYTNSALVTSYLLGTKSGNTLSDPVLRIKGRTSIVPEVVGGNGDLSYTMTVTKNNQSAAYYTKANTSLGVSGGDYSGSGSNTEIKQPVIDLTVETMLQKGSNNGYLVDDSGNPQLLTFTIWDSTEGLAQGSTSQHAVIEMVATLNLQDSEPPKTFIKPFWWKSKTENSVYKDGTNLKGHIDIGSDIGTIASGVASINDDDDKVSGSIIIEGSASDNVLLQDIYMKIFTGNNSASGTNAFTFPLENGTTAATEELENNASSIGTFYRVAHYDNGWQTYGNFADNGWKFSIVQDSEKFTQTGHTLKWKLELNTEKLGSKAYGDLKVLVLAKDKGSPSLDANDNNALKYSPNTGIADTVKTSANAEKNYNKMDVVPYITGVSTRLSSLKKNNPSIYNRSALGHYTVGSDETIVIAGYNLEGAKYNGSGNALTSLTTDEVGALLPYYAEEATSFVKLPVSDISTSGGIKLTQTENKIPTLNNLNNNDGKAGAAKKEIIDNKEQDVPITALTDDNCGTYGYNRQPNGDSNQKLTDDVYFDIWEFDSDAVKPISGKIEQPVMKINPANDKIGFAFVNGPLYFSMGGNDGGTDYSYQYWMGSYDFFTSVGFTYDKLGYSYGTAAGGDINSNAADHFNLMTSRWGTGGHGQRGSYDGENALRLESIAIKENDINQFDKQRIKSPSLTTAVHGSSTNLYLAYYDQLSGEIRFKYGAIGSGDLSTTYSVTIANTNRLRFNNQTEADAIASKAIWLLDNSKSVIGTATASARQHSGSGYDYVTLNNASYNTGKSINNIANLAVRPSKEEFGNFTDQDTGEPPKALSHASVSLIAGGTSGRAGGEYVSIAAISSEGATVDDTVVAVWYDSETLWYAYNTTPTTDRKNTTNGAGWTVSRVFAENSDQERAGEYCKVTVDKDGGVHIACYDPINLDLCYAYMPSSKRGVGGQSDFQTCVVDSNGVVGSNLNIDVAKVNGKWVPYIGYYATSCVKPKYAYLADTTTAAPAGVVNDAFTGAWECMVLPTSSQIEMQSNQHNDINIGVWKDSTSGVIKTSYTTGTNSHTASGTGYESTSYGQVYGNGKTDANGNTYPVLGYAVKNGASSDYIETAQMK